LKETGSKETGSKETGSKETGLKETGLKEIGLKEIGLKEIGLKEIGLKETGTQSSQEASHCNLECYGLLRMSADLLNYEEAGSAPEVSSGGFLKLIKTFQGSEDHRSGENGWYLGNFRSVTFEDECVVVQFFFESSFLGSSSTLQTVF
jgi:hypothetical protein